MTERTMSDRLHGIWRDWRGFLLFIAVMLVFRSAIADWNQVPSGSMQPTILIGDRIVVDKLAYDLRIPFTLRRLARWHEPERGDVVTFPSPKNEQLLVKRIVGIPGDVVSLSDNVLTINGEQASYTTPGRRSRPTRGGRRALPVPLPHRDHPRQHADDHAGTWRPGFRRHVVRSGDGA